MRNILYLKSGLCESNEAKLAGARRYAQSSHWRLQVVLYADDCVVGDIVAEMGCGRRMAEILFREVADRSILDEIRAVRLELAKAMLTNTAASVPEIARDCGCGTVGRLRDLFLVEKPTWNHVLKHGLD